VVVIFVGAVVVGNFCLCSLFVKLATRDIKRAGMEDAVQMMVSANMTVIEANVKSKTGETTSPV